MSIKYHFSKRINGLNINSGDIIKFYYQGFEHDPHPIVIFLYATSGNHPTSKNQWRFCQGISLSYISRRQRKQFVNDWLTLFNRNANVKLTYTIMRTRYPFMTEVTRRYFYKPTYYIRKLEVIPPDRIYEEVVGSLVKDYSRQAKKAFFARWRKMTRRMF